MRARWFFPTKTPHTGRLCQWPFYCDGSGVVLLHVIYTLSVKYRKLTRFGESSLLSFCRFVVLVVVVQSSPVALDRPRLDLTFEHLKEDIGLSVSYRLLAILLCLGEGVSLDRLRYFIATLLEPSI